MIKITVYPKDPNSTALGSRKGIKFKHKPWKKGKKIEFTDDEWKSLAKIFKGDPAEIQRKLRDEW
jgi:hypothetical protein